MTLQECKDYLLKPVNTPVGAMILYGINLIPNSDAIGLIFYLGGKQIIYFSIDCNIIKS